MIEHYCRSGIYEMCERFVYIPLAWLKGKPKPEEKFPNFLKETDKFTIYDKKFVKRMVHEPSNSPLRQACGLFSRNGGLIAQAFIDDWYNGSWETAMEKSQRFDNLYNQFLVFFRHRRKLFMEKTDNLINTGIENGEIKFQKNRIPASHGGVANLLKVLTKTMQDQGSSIRTIAKTQYIVCCQAGIYLPDEFITDVLVAADMTPDLWLEDMKNDKKRSNSIHG